MPESEETPVTDAEVEVEVEAAAPEGATHVSKPGYIQAIQWDGENWAECCFWAPGKARFGAHSGELTLLVDKDGVMGEHVVPVGHWLVCQAGDKSDIWPVGADYFAEKYAALEAAAALRQPREGAETLADALSAPAGICDDNAEPHAHGGFCTNWRTTEAALAESREQYAKLVEHHRQCELAGTELCEAAKGYVMYAPDGPTRERMNRAMMTWDAHQWPEIMNAEMGDEQ